MSHVLHDIEKQIIKLLQSTPNSATEEQLAHETELSMDQIEKGEFPHHMLKEIYEQVHTITDTMRGRIDPSDGSAHLGGITDQIDRIKSANRIYITACGTSWHAGLIGKYLIEEYARIPCLLYTSPSPRDRG